MTANSARPDILVVGYGNELRGDDGIGPRVAAEIAARALPGVRVLALRQLTPELAGPLAKARLAVFIDARGPGEGAPVQMHAVVPGAGGGLLSHATGAAGLLSLALALFGRAPPAWLVTVVGESFALGDGLSPSAIGRVEAAVLQVEALLRQGDLDGSVR
jgi:hydrogenase maturation protease